MAMSCVTPCPAAETLVIGQVAPLTGAQSQQSRDYAQGMTLAFNKANQAGGAGARLLRLAQRDDKGQAAQTPVLTQSLLDEEKPVALAGFFGERGIDELVAARLLEREKIALVGYRVDSILGEPPNVYNVRATLADEIGRIAGHLATVGVTRLGLFYKDGPEARALVTAVEDAARVRGLSVTLKASYPAAGKLPAGVAEGFVSASPQAILIIADTPAVAEFVGRYRSAGGGSQVFAHAGTDVGQLAKLLPKDQMKGIAITQVTPNPFKITTRLSKELADIVAATSGPEVTANYAMMEGYITGSVIADAVRRMGRKAGREAFVTALEAVDIDLGGHGVSFKSGVRSATRFVELTFVTEAGRVRQ
jgi:ABC-type branched-subunit amino acid transport system substrate-binding protein